MYIGKRITAGVVVPVLLGLHGLMQAQTLPSESYAWNNVAMGGGGFVTGIITHPRQNRPR